jgi:DNA adenine methylase
MKPFLKWIGGKTQIINEVLSRFPNTIYGDYHEPFVGGGSVLLGFLSHLEANKIKIKGSIYAYDKNKSLIDVYQVIKNDLNLLLTELKILCDVYNNANKSDTKEVHRNPQNFTEALTSQESVYYWYRNEYNKHTTNNIIKKSALFLFLNKTCFRGMYREGPKGFNVPFGNYKSPRIYDEDHLRKISDLFQKYNVKFVCSSFEKSLNDIILNSFVYLDPPYALETNTSFVGYVADGFKEEDHKKLFEICRNLVSNNKTKIVMSNANVSTVIDSFCNQEFDIDVLECRRAINSKKPQSKTTEVLVFSK